MQSNLSIREFKPQDAKEIVRLHSASETYFEKMDISEEFILNISQRPDFRFFIATINEKLIGFIGVLFHENVGRAEIGPIAVDEMYRNINIGTRLLERTINFLKEREIHRLISRIKANNQMAMDFFLHRGFQKEGYFKGYTKKRDDVVQLVRFI